MVDIDIAQSRLLQKQAITEAAKIERDRLEANKHRKRKADPRQCGREKNVLLAHAHLSDGWVETFADNLTASVRTIDISHNSISKLASSALFSSLLPNLKTLVLKALIFARFRAAVEKHR